MADTENGDDMLVYRRTVTLTVACHWELDEDDLDNAILYGLTGIPLRVEHNETLDTSWVPIDVIAVTSSEGSRTPVTGAKPEIGDVA